MSITLDDQFPGGRHGIGHRPDMIRWPDLKDKATTERLAPGAKVTPAGSKETPSGVGPSGVEPAGQTEAAAAESRRARRRRFIPRRQYMSDLLAVLTAVVIGGSGLTILARITDGHW